MPEGVEHPGTVRVRSWDKAVRTALMPEGVEHCRMATCVDVRLAG